MVRNAWAKFGVKVWLGAGIVGDRTLISQFTGEDEERLGGFPVNSSDCMVNDQSVNSSWKNLLGGLYETFHKRKPSRRTNGGFINDINSSFENLSQEKIQNAIDLQPKIMQAITVESKKSLKKIANFGKVKNVIFSKKMLKIES